MQIETSRICDKNDRYILEASLQTRRYDIRHRQRDAPGWPEAAAVCHPVQRTYLFDKVLIELSAFPVFQIN